uniref:ribosomal protein L32 n=1 Tax=Pellia epiphylla TaxID=40340 RepID=UPI00257E3420|nr:ribosomal protein L32 [Pellia epiphylla]WIA67429.1 ribosomal protein L32 [Pellia epiphylla var. borealis]WIA67514.1 ribosomal protein L32 [Pellia epiphylla var. borealis]WIA67952.1 ribosomal protein L32 [Pellia epiphylla]WIA68037.1 ribosomal protein L32 [Pellia epiphylla]WIA68123.1 ribosomal protein L32 [Pellia epiphylla]
MAVPKKRTSKAKTRIRKSIWRDKAKETAIRAFSPAKSILTNRSKSFYYSVNDELSNSSESISVGRDDI